MNKQNLNNLITEALAIDARDAKDAGALGFMARAIVQATLPHSKVNGNEFRRTNGLFNLTLLADSKIGLPYGIIPRLLLAWVSTEAVKTKSRHLVLGKTLAAFMEELDLIPSGGLWGTITRLKDQMKRLFASSISCTYDDGKHWAIKNINPVSNADLWWDPKSPNQAALFQSTLTLNEDFFNEIISHPIPIDMRSLKALKRSPLALDIYCWLTYRMSYIKNHIFIPWAVLQLQFGSSYSSNPQELRDFKRAFLRELKKIYLMYSGLKLSSSSDGLTLYPSKSHIKKSLCITL